MRRRPLHDGTRTLLAAVALLTATVATGADDAPLTLKLRSRVEDPAHKGQFRVVEKAASWDPKRDGDHRLRHVGPAPLPQRRPPRRRDGADDGPGAQGRPRPGRPRSSTRRAVAWTPTRTTRPASGRPRRPGPKTFPAEIGKWCYKIPAEEKGVYPIDQTDGGEDDDPAEHAKWADEARRDGPQSQGPVEVADRPPDDRPRSRLHQRQTARRSGASSKIAGSSNVILLGVHPNMCVLGRPFGLRQMAKNGKNVVLMRDMTDTMYNPAPLAVREPLRRHRPDRRARREVRLPDDHQRPAPRRHAVPVQGGRGGRARRMIVGPATGPSRPGPG